MPLSFATNFLSHPRRDPIKPGKAEICYLSEKVNRKFVTFFPPVVVLVMIRRLAEEDMRWTLSLFFFLFFYSFFKKAFIYMYAHSHTYYDAHKEIREQFVGVWSPLRLCGFWRLKSCQAGQRVPLPTEPS